MGNEHPFNPTVALVEADSSEGDETEKKSEAADPAALLAFNHAAYLFVPYNHQLQMQSNALKEAQAQSGRQNRPYRRPPPMMMDTHSLISQAPSLTSSTGEVSPDLLQYRRNAQAYRGKASFPNSPGRQFYHRSNANNPQHNPLFPMGMDMSGIPIPPPPSGYSYPSVPVYPPPLYAHAPFYPAQMHNSLGSSISSSYGQTSPMSQSPMTPSYMLHAHLPGGPATDFSAMPQHPGSPNTRNRPDS